MRRLPRPWTVAAIALSMAAQARAAEPGAIAKSPVDRMIDLNRRAYLDIKSQRFSAARYWLAEALVISETASLENDEMTARTYVHLAVVHLTGLRDREEAVRNFELALKINPNITITAGLETPALKSAYLTARERLELPPNPDPTAITKSSEPKTSPVEPTIAAVPRLTFLSNTTEADPDLPARVPAPLFCSAPFEVPRDKDLMIRCVTQKQQKRAIATLYYRPDGAGGKYASLPMTRSPKGWLVALIPAHELVGRSLSYYVKAQLPASQLAIYSGYPETPTAVLLKGAATADGMVAGGDGRELGHGKAGHRRAARAIWIALGFGTGTVYHGRDTVGSDATTAGGEPVPVEAGFSPAWAFQLEPELGYQLTSRFSLSLLARYQYVPTDGGGATDAQAVPTSALAGFIRGQLFFGSRGNLQPYASLGLGFGRSFLAVIDKRCTPDRCPLDHRDTLAGGSLGLLAGLGILYNFTPRFAVTVDFKEIVTAAKILALSELNVGVAFAHDFGTMDAPAGTVRTSPLATP